MSLNVCSPTRARESDGTELVVSTFSLLALFFCVISIIVSYLIITFFHYRFISEPRLDENSLSEKATLSAKKNIDDVVSGKQGLLLLPTSTHPEFSVSRCTDTQLFRARHINELNPSKDSIFVRIDAAQRGLGTGSCGPQTLPEYQINDDTEGNTCKLSFWIKPIGFGDK
mmetsp:Transcript_10320/g.18972  ORF Transcript_10320/g.18972 Transcript_10320/m.18972 type:complete len:170 (+) Transcript_10320:3504-4013(+)